jgi:hypothetical protein
MFIIVILLFFIFIIIALKNEMGGACSAYGREERYVGKPEGRRSLGRPRRRWGDNIKMDL